MIFVRSLAAGTGLIFRFKAHGARQGSLCRLGWEPWPAAGAKSATHCEVIRRRRQRWARGPRTSGEIDGAAQFSDLSARCGQFQALAFPRSEPCRSRCPVLAGLVRARTSDDIRPRAACTPPPKSFAPVLPGLATQQGCHAHHVWSALFRALDILRGR